MYSHKTLVRIYIYIRQYEDAFENISTTKVSHYSQACNIFYTLHKKIHTVYDLLSITILPRKMNLISLL